MATSDSEDFESADEDLDLQSDHAFKRDSKHRDHDKHGKKESSDNKATNIKTEMKNEEFVSGDSQAFLGDLSDSHLETSTLNVTANTDRPVANVSDSEIKDVIGDNGPPIVEDKSKSKPPNERPKRQQRPREPKSSSSIKKLGTKISSNNVRVSPESESQKVELDLLASEKCEKNMNSSDNDKNEEKLNISQKPVSLEENINQLCLEDKEKNELSTVLDKLSQSSSEKGLSTVLETGIGAPDPEELARLDKEEEMKLLEEKEQNKANELSELQREEENHQKSESESSGLFGFGNIISGVSSITKLVETTGSKVLTGGLDTLETIGKKTMEVLQEGDPGLKKKRAIFTEKIVLSQVLREAKEKAELEAQEIEDKEAARKAHFETLFDDYQGLVHLEALEMLSKQCDIKLQSVLLTSTGAKLSKLQDSVKIIKDLCQLPDDEDLDEEIKDDKWVEKLEEATRDLGVPFATDKLSKTWEESQKWLEEYHNKTSLDSEQNITTREIHQKAIATLAQLTAAAVEQITTVMTSQLSTVATRFSECLNTASEGSADSDAVNALITNIFLEAANSSSYIQEAFQLLIPVLQVGVTL
ncbi:hypothetical protein C0J52_01820 [Blattella germanica]|nr:hypothetical protein C0J52_01820 [Blattella germanica]